VRRQRTYLNPLAFLAALALATTALLSACGDPGGGGGGPACAVDPGECPNICESGTGVEGEICTANTDCGCGLFCEAGSGACAPYAGGNADCSCEQITVDPIPDTTGGGTPDTTVQEDIGDGPVDDCPKLAPAAFPCNPFCQTGCDDDLACTYNSGAGVCAPAGPGAMGDVCTGTSCDAGHTCIKFTADPQSTCRRFCIDDADCGEDRKCNLTVNGLFTICSEPTVGCDLFDDPATACEAGMGCYYNNQTSQCLPAGTKQGGDGVMGTCAGGSVQCMGDPQCTGCVGYVPDADAQDGVCFGTPKVCGSHEACQQCEGYSPESAEEIFGTCTHDGTTPCLEDLACVGACDGYEAPSDGTLGSCTNDATAECDESAECAPTCDGFEAGSPEVKGTCFNDAALECASDSDCADSICTGNIPAGQDTPGACSSDDSMACEANAECLPACLGVGDPIPEVKGDCSDDDTVECSSDADCAAGVCVGNIPPTTATTGECADEGDTVCTTDADCVPTCEGFAAANDEVMGACAGDDTPCQADDACTSSCEGYVPVGLEVMGVCSDGKALATECMDDSECTEMCDQLIEATDDTPGACAYDDTISCTAAEPCDSICEGYVAGGVGEICSGASDCVPGMQCLVVCTSICSLDGTAGLPCAGCPAPADPNLPSGENNSFISINADNNMGICIDENVPAACDLYNQTGCAPGEACYSIRGGHGCLGAGTQPEGTECKFSNDCSGGNLCVNSMCLEACDTKADPGAPESCDVKCNGTTPGNLSPAVWGTGFCQDAPPAEPCSFWKQDCEGGKVCYGTSLGEACLTPDGTAGEGATCSRNQDCAAGLVCPNSNSPNGNTCTRPCSIIIPDFDGSQTDCSGDGDCGLPESCFGSKCIVPYCADECPAAAAQPVATDSIIGTCDQQ